MRVLHTSDWHIGRTFHGHSTVEHLRTVLGALVRAVREHDVDLVVVAGDVFDSSTPAADYFEVLTEVLRDLHAAGATVVVTSGNHDSATRLGFQSEWAALAGIHVITRDDAYATPVVLSDADGAVNVYGIPYLEPALIRHKHPGIDVFTHQQALGLAMQSINEDRERRGGRSIVLSHCFVVDVPAIGAGNDADDLPHTEATDVERDITAGGLNYVPLSVFDGPDYVALGHIHGRTTLSDRVRYSGAPLHYSFSEAGKPRGAWLVDLRADGLDSVEWMPLPVPRALRVLTGTLDSLLENPEYAAHTDDWVAAILTDRLRPLDAMRRLQSRFPHAAMLQYRPDTGDNDAQDDYSGKVKGRSDTQIIAGFLELVRAGEGPSDIESGILGDIIAALDTAERTA